MSPVSCPTSASILLLLSIAFGFSEACSSRSAAKLRPPQVSRPNLTHPCPRGPAERLCLNGGTCFTLFENSTDFFCKCAEGYCGATCVDKYTRNGCYSSSYSSSSLVKISGSGIPRPPETFPCPPGPAEWLCLNGGTCFTVFENATDFACHCTEGYCGLNCGEKYTRYGCFSRYLEVSAAVAGAGTVAAVFFFLLIIMATYIRYQKKSPSGDAELKNYFERSMKSRMCNRNVHLKDEAAAAAAATAADSNKGKNEAPKKAPVKEELPVNNYLFKDEEDLKGKKFFNHYLNLIRLI